jgi:hypothetical protein
VYQAALRDGGPNAEGHIFRGILRTLARALAPPPAAGAQLPAQQPVLVVFTEIADTEVNDGLLPSPNRKRRLGRRDDRNSGRRSSDDDDLRESPMDEEESVEVKR